MPMRAKGYFTVEAAFIISILVMVIAQIIKLDFYLHDCLVLETSHILSEIRYKNADEYYYDADNKSIEVNELIKEPVEGGDTEFANSAEKVINTIMSDYFDSAAIYNEVQYEDFDSDDIEISLFGHSDLVRLGESIKRLTGGF